MQVISCHLDYNIPAFISTSGVIKHIDVGAGILSQNKCKLLHIFYMMNFVLKGRAHSTYTAVGTQLS